MEYSDNWRSVMAAKTSAAKKKAGSGGRSAKKTTSGVKAVHSTKPSGRTTSKTTAHKKNGSRQYIESESHRDEYISSTHDWRNERVSGPYRIWAGNDDFAQLCCVSAMLCEFLWACRTIWSGNKKHLYEIIWLDGMDDSDGNRSCCYFFDRKSGRQTRTAPELPVVR